MRKKITKKSLSLIFCLQFLLLSCNKSDKLIKATYENSIDSIVVYKDKNGHIECIYNILNNKDKFVKEGICFLSNGEIDYDKSRFLKIDGNKLYYFSPYNRFYKIGTDRYVVFKGNDSIKKDFSNLELLKLSEFNFNENGVIENYDKKIPKIGIVEEIIFLDTLVKSEKGNEKIIETIISYIDLENLLISKLKKKSGIKNN
ncbi:hypothetical protein [Flavobacterium cheonhonense]|uniref:hypothetical protein n=1 Tax=Flavobacterium cheonhonense TaxID=706185 RepID=UPI002D796156|nr:hypothetical protein [Flavobacterium cheonhonense]